MGQSQRRQGLKDEIENRVQELEKDRDDLRSELRSVDNELRSFRALQSPDRWEPPVASDDKSANAGQLVKHRKRQRMSHNEVIEMIANVLTEAGVPLQLDEIFRRVKEKSLTDGTEMPGQGARGNIAVHLSPAAYPDAIYPVKRMRRGVYGLEGRD